MKLTKSINSQRKTIIIFLQLNPINNKKNRKFPSKSVCEFALGEETFWVVWLTINRQTGKKLS